MKKLSKILVLFPFLFSLSGCGVAIGLMVRSGVKSEISNLEKTEKKTLAANEVRACLYNKYGVVEAQSTREQIMACIDDVNEARKRQGRTDLIVPKK